MSDAQTYCSCGRLETGRLLLTGLNRQPPPGASSMIPRINGARSAGQYAIFEGQERDAMVADFDAHTVGDREFLSWAG